MTPAEKAQLLQRIVRALGDAFPVARFFAGENYPQRSIPRSEYTRATTVGGGFRNPFDIAADGAFLARLREGPAGPFRERRIRVRAS